VALIVRTYSSRAHPALFSTRCSNVGSCNLRPRMISLARGCVLSLPTLPTARHTKPEAGWRPQVSQAQQRRPLAWTCDCLCTALQSAVRERGYLHTAGPTLPRERQRVGSHELRASGRGGGAGAGAVRVRVGPPPPPSRTKWTRLVHPSVLTGHVSSLSPRCGCATGRSSTPWCCSKTARHATRAPTRRRARTWRHSARAPRAGLTRRVGRGQDAERYSGLLEAQNFPTPHVEALDPEEILEFTCANAYKTSFIPEAPPPSLSY